MGRIVTNDAAERLRRWLAVDGRYVDAHPMVDWLVDAALAAERRAMVERYDARVLMLRGTLSLIAEGRGPAPQMAQARLDADDKADAILDTEAER